MVIIQVYAPTADAKDADINEFYDTLQSTIAEVPSKACVVLMGDFNAKVGDSKCAAPGVMGKFGYGRSNSRGDQLLNFCGINNLVIANTLFKQKKENRSWTWESPDGKVHNQIDYIIVSRKWRTSIINSRAYPSADVGSDHQLLISNLRLKLKRQQTSKQTKRFDVGKLKDPQIHNMYEVTIGGKFAALLENEHEEVGVDETWSAIKDAFNSTSTDTLSVIKFCKTKQWLSDRTRQLADERRSLKVKKGESRENTKHYKFLCRENRQRSL